MWLRLLLFGTVLAFLLTMAVAGTVTVGLSRWCSSFPDTGDIAYVSLCPLCLTVFPCILVVD